MQLAGAVSAVQLTLMTLEEAAAPFTPLGSDGAEAHEPPPLPAAALTENPLTASPWPPVHISKPYSTSISHHEGSRLPRDTASLKNGRRFKLLTEVTGVSRTYETMFHDDSRPVHTSQVAPSMVVVAVCEPKGCGDPW